MSYFELKLSQLGLFPNNLGNNFLQQGLLQRYESSRKYTSFW